MHSLDTNWNEAVVFGQCLDGNDSQNWELQRNRFIKNGYLELSYWSIIQVFGVA